MSAHIYSMLHDEYLNRAVHLAETGTRKTPYYWYITGILVNRLDTLQELNNALYNSTIAARIWLPISPKIARSKAMLPSAKLVSLFVIPASTKMCYYR